MRVVRARVLKIAAALTVAGAGWTTPDAHAEFRSWDGGGGDGNWANTANWNPDGLPSSIADVAFNIGIPAGGGVYSAGGTINSLTVGTVNPFDLNGTAAGLTLASSGTSLIRQDVSGTEADHTIFAGLTLAANTSWAINGSGTFRVNGVTSPFNLTKNGNGFLHLNSSGVSGTIAVNNGLMRIGFFSVPTSLSIAAGRELRVFDVSSPASGPVSMAGTAASPSILRCLTAGTVGQLTLAGSNNRLYSDGSGTFTVSGITDGGAGYGWEKNGLGVLSVTGPGTYTGTTQVSAGTLIAGHNSALGSGSVLVAAGTKLSGANNVTVPNPVSLAGSLGISGTGASTTFSGPVTLTANASISESSGTINISGPITDSGAGLSLTKSGTGTVVLSNSANTFANLTVAVGTLRAAANQSGIGSITVQNAGVLEVQDGVTVSSPVQINGAGLGALGALGNSAGTGVISGPVTLQSNASVGGSGNLSLLGTVAGNFTLTKAGAGVLDFGNASNTFPALSVAGGVVALSSTGQIGNATVTVASAGSVRLDGTLNTINRPLVLNGGVLTNSGSLNTWGGPVTLGTGGGRMSPSSGSITISGNISGNQTLVKESTGDLVLSGNNSFAAASVTGGTLTLQSLNALPPGATATVASGASLRLNGSITTNSTATARLNGPGTLASPGALSNAVGNNTFAGPVVIASADATIGVSSGSTLTLSNTVSDDTTPLPLVKVGPGTLALAGSNAFKGVVVNAGTLSISSDANLGDVDGQITVNNGSRLLVTSVMTAGTRTFNLNTGSIQVNAGATLRYAGSTVSGGFLRGPGVHEQIGVTNRFNGVTALPGTVMQQNGVVYLTNFTNSGSFANNVPLVWEAGYNTSSGTLTIASDAFTSAFENTGTITINNAGTLSNSESDLVSGGGSRLTVNAGGTLSLNGTNLNLHGALAVNNGTIVGGTTNVHFGSLLAGNGNFGPVTLHPGGVFTPGANLANIPSPTPSGDALITPLDANIANASALTLAADTTAAVDAADGTLTLSGAVSGPGVTLTKTGAGTLRVGSLQTAAVEIDGGTVAVLESAPGLGSGHPSGNNASVSRASSLDIAPGATLDLTNNDLILDYSGVSPLATYEALVASGYNVTGDWQGSGITSSVAAADGNYVIAIADNALLAAPFGTAQGGPLFSGRDVDLTTVLVKFTHRADINLDGLITPDDSAIFGGNYDETQPATWATGDMNYDGMFTPDDAAIFGGAYDESLTSLPEPAGTLTGFCAAALLLIHRRRGLRNA